MLKKHPLMQKNYRKYSMLPYALFPTQSFSPHPPSHPQPVTIGMGSSDIH
jgi:hypothetical protein